MTEWISVNFAVPPDSRNILVSSLYAWTRPNGEKRESRTTYMAQRIVFRNGKVKWRAQGGGYIGTPESNTKITHWMHLPGEPRNNEL